MYSKYIQILRHVEETGSCTREAVWTIFGMNSYQDTDLCISDLIKANLLQCKNGKFPYMDLLTIAPKGCECLEEFKKEAEEESKAQRQQRFENKMSIATLLISLISFIVGLVVEHYAGILAAIFTLLH